VYVVRDNRNNAGEGAHNGYVRIRAEAHGHARMRREVVIRPIAAYSVLFGLLPTISP
jgi:hypothetical protein